MIQEQKYWCNGEHKTLVIIRGNSGSGKTTVAKELRQRLGHNIMLLSQDVIRRDILRVKDGEGNPALPLMFELLEYGHQHCDITIMEGIYRSEWYKPLFERAKSLYGSNILAYYYDLSFEETLLRHHTKSNRADFGEMEMREWWKEKDYLGIIPEKTITDQMDVEETVLQILKDIQETIR